MLDKANKQCYTQHIDMLTEQPKSADTSLKTTFQEQSTSCWENIYVLFSQPGESPTLFRPGGSEGAREREFFSGKDVFAGQKGEAGIKKKPNYEATNLE